MSLTCACLCSQFKRNSIITPSQSGYCDGPQSVMQTVSLEHPGFVDVGTCELQDLSIGVFLESYSDGAASHSTQWRCATDCRCQWKPCAQNVGMELIEPLITENVDLNMSVPKVSEIWTGMVRNSAKCGGWKWERNILRVGIATGSHVLCLLLHH